jgi:CheY-like chemotaxis protein
MYIRGGRCDVWQRIPCNGAHTGNLRILPEFGPFLTGKGPYSFLNPVRYLYHTIYPISCISCPFLVIFRQFITTGTNAQETDVTSNQNQRRILIVDDEEDLRTLLGHVLSTAGYDIVAAPDGDAALKLLKKQKFDLALLDIQMPNVNGIQVLKYIQQNLPTTRAVMLTGYADLKHAMEAKEFGARDFIGKPYKLDDILATVERVLKE